MPKATRFRFLISLVSLFMVRSALLCPWLSGWPKVGFWCFNANSWYLAVLSWILTKFRFISDFWDWVFLETSFSFYFLQLDWNLNNFCPWQFSKHMKKWCPGVSKMRFFDFSWICLGSFLDNSRVSRGSKTMILKRF